METSLKEEDAEQNQDSKKPLSIKVTATKTFCSSFTQKASS